VARAVTAAGFLAADLAAEPDIAGTLLHALLRHGSVHQQAHCEDLRHGLLRYRGELAVVWSQAAPPCRGHIGAVTDLDHHQGMVASGGEDGTVRLWQLDDRDHRRCLHGHIGWVYAVRISPDGQITASAGDDAVIRLWATATGEPAGVLAGHTRRIRALAFTPDNRRLVSGSEDATVRIWDLGGRTPPCCITVPGLAIWAVAVTNNLLAVAGSDTHIRLFDLPTGDLLADQSHHSDWIRSLAFAPGSAQLVSGSGDRRVQLWNTTNRTLAFAATAVTTAARVRTVATTAHATRIFSAGEDATIRAHPTDEPAAEQPMPAGVDWIRAITLIDDATVLAGCEDGALRVWHARAPQPLATFAAGSNTVWATAVRDAGRTVLFGGGNGTIDVRDATSGHLRRTVPAGVGRVWSLATGGDRTAAACGDGRVRVWAADRDEPVLCLNTDTHRTWAVALSPDGQYLAASTADGLVRLWDATGTLLWQHPANAGRVRSLSIAADTLAIAGGTGTASLWNLTTGDRSFHITDPAGWVRTVALDAAATMLATGAGPGDIRVYDITSGGLLAHLDGHRGRVLMLGFAADADRLASAAADGTVRVWSPRAAHQIAQIRADASLQCAAFDPTSGTIVAGSATGMTVMTMTPTVHHQPGSRR
jgi:WD40 repeat protein